jgi:hypothetical protein
MQPVHQTTSSPSNSLARKLAPYYGPPLLLIGCPLAMVLMPIWLPALIVSHRWREWRFRERMRRAGRFVHWFELLPRLNRGEGTLIVEQAQKASCRVWWTDQDVRAAAGNLAVPESTTLDYFRTQAPHPFVRWCHERFTAAKGGTAFLTRSPYRHPPGFVEASFYREKFPTLAVVVTVLLS